MKRKKFEPGERLPEMKCTPKAVLTFGVLHLFNRVSVCYLMPNLALMAFGMASL